MHDGETIDRPALRSLAAAATQGPFHAVEQPECARASFGAATVEQTGPGTFDPVRGARTWTVVASFASVDDARYIAAAHPAVVLALLDALEEAERALTQARADLLHYGACLHPVPPFAGCASRFGKACDCGLPEALARAEGQADV